MAMHPQHDLISMCSHPGCYFATAASAFQYASRCRRQDPRQRLVLSLREEPFLRVELGFFRSAEVVLPDTLENLDRAAPFPTHEHSSSNYFDFEVDAMLHQAESGGTEKQREVGEPTSHHERF